MDAEVLEAEKHLILDDGGDHLGVDVLEDRPDDLGDVGQGHVAGILPIDERRPIERALVVMGDGS